MKRIAFVLVAIAMVAGVVAITAPASGQADVSETLPTANREATH